MKVRAFRCLAATEALRLHKCDLIFYQFPAPRDLQHPQEEGFLFPYRGRFSDDPFLMNLLTLHTKDEIEERVKDQTYDKITGPPSEKVLSCA